MNVHSGNPWGGMSFPHPPDFTGFPIASHNPFGKFPPGSLLRPPLPIVESGPSRDKTPRAQPTGASAGGLALVPGARFSSSGPVLILHVVPPAREAQGMGRAAGEEKRRQHRREGGDVGEGLVSSEPKRLPPHRTARLPRSQSPGTRSEPPNPTTLATRRLGAGGHQVLKRAHRIRGVLHDHNDPAHAGAVFGPHMRIATGPSWWPRRPFGIRDAA